MDMYTDKLIRYTLAIVLVGASDTCVAMADVMRSLYFIIADNKVHGANMGTTWGRQDPGGPHVGPMNFDIWDIISTEPTDTWPYGCATLNMILRIT